MANRWENNGNNHRLYFLGLQNHCRWWLNKSYDKPRKPIKKQGHYFANKGPYSQNYGVSTSYVWMWELDHKEDWVPKNWCFWTVVLEKTLDSPLDCKKIKPVSPNRNQSWILIGRTDAEVVAPEVDDRGRDGWKASPIQGTWRTGNPDVLQFTGSQRVEHNSTRVRKCYCLVAIMPFTWYAQGTVEKFCVYSSQVKCRVEENWSKSSL